MESTSYRKLILTLTAIIMSDFENEHNSLSSSSIILLGFMQRHTQGPTHSSSTLYKYMNVMQFESISLSCSGRYIVCAVVGGAK